MNEARDVWMRVEVVLDGAKYAGLSQLPRQWCCGDTYCCVEDRQSQPLDKSEAAASLDEDKTCHTGQSLLLYKC